MLELELTLGMTTSCCLLRSPYGVTVCGGAHARTLTRMQRQRQTVRVVHHGGSSTLNDGRASVQCALCMVGTRVLSSRPGSAVSSPHQSELRTTVAPVAPVIKLPPLPASGSATARSQYFNADHHPALLSEFSVLRSSSSTIPPFRHSAIPPFNSPMVQ